MNNDIVALVSNLVAQQQATQAVIFELLATNRAILEKKLITYEDIDAAKKLIQKEFEEARKNAPKIQLPR